MYLFYFYLIVGATMAIWFCFFKVKKIDSATVGAGFWFNLIIMPGVILLWPLVIYRLFFAKNGYS